MKTFLLTVILAVLTSAAFCQQSKRIVYLTIWFDDNDGVGAPKYYILRADTANTAVPEVTGLIDFKKNKKSKNPVNASYYADQKDTAQKLFNYFVNHAAGLEYLNRYGWQLVSVVSENFSGLKLESRYKYNGYWTVVTTRQVFYLKKEVE